MSDENTEYVERSERDEEDREERKQHRRMRIALAQVVRLGRRKSGGVLCDVAISLRVPGATLDDVRAVRTELELHGVLADELEEGGIE